MSQYFFGGYSDGGASMLTSAQEDTEAGSDIHQHRDLRRANQRPKPEGGAHMLAQTRAR